MDLRFMAIKLDVILDPIKFCNLPHKIITFV